MALETATYISDLNASNPLGTDQRSTVDDHLRLIKSTVKATFPNLSGAVTPTHTELNFVDGVTSAIQTQIDATVKLTGNQTVAGVKTFSSTPVMPTQSMVRLNTANGYGSTNTGIRRFTNTVTNQGTDITYADSATLGATFTINANGVYAISYNDQLSASSSMGLSLSAASPTASLSALPVAEILAYAVTSAANVPATAAVTAYLVSGAVVRAHTNGTSSGTLTQACQFTITRVA